MSDSDRGQYSKTGLIAGVVFAAILGLSFVLWGHSESAKYQREADYQTAQYEGHTDKKVAQSCVGIPPREQAICLNDAMAGERENKRNEQDLVAQRNSALWAYLMALAAITGMGLSAVGVFLVWTTFRETQRTANAAVEMQKLEMARSFPKMWISPVFQVKLGAYPDPLPIRLCIEYRNEGFTHADDFHIAEALVTSSDGTFQKTAFNVDGSADLMRDVPPKSENNSFLLACEGVEITRSQVENKAFDDVTVQAEIRYSYVGIDGPVEKPQLWKGKLKTRMQSVSIADSPPQISALDLYAQLYRQPLVEGG